MYVYNVFLRTITHREHHDISIQDVFDFKRCADLSVNYRNDVDIIRSICAETRANKYYQSCVRLFPFKYSHLN